jgi:amino acid transporter
MLSRFRKKNISLGTASKLGLRGLVMTIFFCVSGGPHGLEPIVQSGKGMALLLIVVVPFLWALPIALMCAELGSAIPEEGGYYQWAKKGIGPHAGFWCGWLTYLYSCVDVAIYPRLFVGYLGALGFEQWANDPLWSTLIRMAMVLPLVWLNIRGASSTGNAATLFAIVLLVPFMGMVAMSIVPALTHAGEIVTPFVPNGMTNSEAFSVGLFVILWNYLGWDSISTISREIKDAPRIFPKALMLSLPMVILIYLLPTVVGLYVMPDISLWTDGSWALVAGRIGGPWLGVALGCVGLISASGLFMAGLLAASRIPFVLSEDGYIPKSFTTLHPKYATPARSILASAVIYISISSFSFEQLAEVDVLLYSSALLLEFIALVRLRRLNPAMPRPFKIPGGIWVTVLVGVVPTLIIIAATAQMLVTSWHETVLLFAVAGLSGWLLLRYRRKQVAIPRSIS